MSRIIAGSAGGRRLIVPPGDATRPTTDRVREAFFSSLAAWLGTSEQPPDSQLAGVAFLDLFAGSGAVGLEAASRGADPVVCVESDARTCDIIRANADAARLAPLVVRDTAQRFLASSGPASTGFDVVWLDPPYGLGDAEVDALVDAVVTPGRLRPDALIVVERSARSRAPRFPADADAWQRRYGETVLHHAQVDGGEREETP